MVGEDEETVERHVAFLMKKPSFHELSYPGLSGHDCE